MVTFPLYMSYCNGMSGAKLTIHQCRLIQIQPVIQAQNLYIKPYKTADKAVWFIPKAKHITEICILHLNTMRTGDADLRF